MSTLGGVWDGEQHWLEPGEYFQDTGATLVLDGWEEDEEEDVLSPLESATRIPILRDTQSREPDPRFPLAQAEQAWGCLSIQLTAMAEIVGVEKKQYEHVWPGQGSTKDEVKWSFKTEQFITERV